MKRISILLGSWLLACGDDGGSADTEANTDVSTGSETEGLPGEQLVLSDGTVVVVGPEGEFAILRDGREVFRLADEARPTVRSYTESYQGGLGIWNVSRSDEVVVAAGELQSAMLHSDVVTMQYLDDGGAGVELRISVHVPGEVTRIDMTPVGVSEADSVALPVRCDDASTFFGFGEQYDGTDQRGKAFELWVTEQGIGRDPNAGRLPFNGDLHTTYFPMPYWLDARGFGGLLTTAYRTDVDLCKSDPTVAWFEVTQPQEAGDVSLLVFSGPTAYDVIRQLGDEVGRPAAPPDWAYRLWVAAQGGREMVEAEAAALRDAEIPFSALWVQDWTGIRMNFDGGFGVEYRWVADEMLYPDLAGMIADLRAQDIRFLGYANPFIDPGLDHYEAMVADQLLIQTEAGEPYTFVAPNGMSSLPDFTNEQARTYTQDHLRAMMTELGMDGFMADFGEWLPLDAKLSDGSDPLAYHNLYPVDWHATWREAVDAARPDGDWVVFTRSGFTGAQAHTQIYWAGDQEATWSSYDGLPTVVPALINLGLAGVPFVTHDIAGFSGGPSTKELFQRWTELGAFTPFMRTHEGNMKTENWSWETDAETTAHFRRFARIHEALIPELMQWAAEAASSSKPIVRHLMLEFPDDPQSRTVSDQYMLGSTYLVAPVVEQGATSREVYLPPGTWYHLWTGQMFEGGTTVTVDAPIGSPPVFTRDEDRPQLREIQ